MVAKKTYLRQSNADQITVLPQDKCEISKMLGKNFKILQDYCDFDLTIFLLNRLQHASAAFVPEVSHHLTCNFFF